MAFLSDVLVTMSRVFLTTILLTFNLFLPFENISQQVCRILLSPIILLLIDRLNWRGGNDTWLNG